MIDADVSVDSIVNDGTDESDAVMIVGGAIEWNEDYSWMLHVAQHYQQATSTAITADIISNQPIKQQST